MALFKSKTPAPIVQPQPSLLQTLANNQNAKLAEAEELTVQAEAYDQWARTAVVDAAIAKKQALALDKAYGILDEAGVDL